MPVQRRMLWHPVGDEQNACEEVSEALHRRAAEISAPKLGELAQRLPPVHHWRQLVLPLHQLDLVRDVIRQIKYWLKVLDEWRFDKVRSRLQGLIVLFSGPPGTGKAMAAEVVAAELRMDLYRIDLASVVSKYIGETEKNLSRIFHEAEYADAILFFDEADALFGKRSEVKDAHARYANIEINHLLQQLETFNGVAISLHQHAAAPGGLDADLPMGYAVQDFFQNGGAQAIHRAPL